MAVASSSVAQVTTRMDSSLSRAASTVFWCVSGHAEDPAEVGVERRLRDLLGEGGAGLAEEVLEGVDDERRGDGFGHCASWAS